MTAWIPTPKPLSKPPFSPAGRTLTPKELADLSGLSEERARGAADDLASEYADRGSGIEIKNIGEGYSMQVRFGLAGRVLSFAPKEIEAPLIRTLAIIAYKQPIKQSDLVEIRGNKSYDHVKELEKRGLINAVRQSRTKLLTTTRGFADYFGITSCNPEAVRRALLQEKKLVGVSPMYESLALRLGLDFIVVNPYKPEAEDLERLKEIDLLVLAPGYAAAGEGELLRRDAGGQRSHSFSAQRERRDDRQAAGCGDVEPLAAEVDSLLKRFRKKGKDGQGNQAAHTHDRGDRPRPSPRRCRRTASELHRTPR